MKNIFTLLFLSLVCIVGVSAQKTLLLNLSTDNGNVDFGTTLEIDVRATNFSDIAGMQFPLLWDASVFEFDEVVNLSSELPLWESNFSNVTDGEMRLTWSSGNAQGVDLAENELLFTVRLHVIGDDCDNSLFKIEPIPSMAVEVFDSNLEEFDVCINSFVAQVKGAACTDVSSNLACTDKVILTLPESKQIQLNPVDFLPGGPYDYSALGIVPSKVTCDDLGISTYFVTDNINNNTCWGQLQVLDGAGYCDGTSGNTLTCNDNIFVSLDQNGQAQLSADVFLEGGPYNYDDMISVPNSVNCDDLGIVPFTVTDVTNGNACWGILTVEDKLDVCNGGSSGNDHLACNHQVDISLSPWGDTEVTPQMVLEGGPYNYSTISISPASVGCDDVGQLIYTVTDNETDNSCWGYLNIEDKTPPVAIVKENIVVSLTFSPNNPDGGTAKVYAESLDNGSWDNCTEVSFSPAYHKVDCSDLGEVNLSFTVTDAYGNSNEAFATITVEIKNSANQINCPNDIVVECTTDINDLSEVGLAAIDNGCILNYNDFNNYDENGDGDFNDTFEYEGVTYAERYGAACGTGVIVRQWSLNSSDVECSQLIYVNSNEPDFSLADISFPDDVTLNCLDTYEGEPTWNERACSLVGWTLNSDTLRFEQGSCFKIVNFYTVIDWCSYNPNNSTEEGIFEHTQIVKIIDDTSDDIVTEDNLELSLCSGGKVSLSAVSISNCSSGTARWEASVDLGSNFNIDETHIATIRTGDQFVFTVDTNVPESDDLHRVVWMLTDNCGNVTAKTTYFKVTEVQTDNVSPTPYCINLSTAVLTNGQVELFASDFNIGSFDNCTEENQLRYTFTDTPPSNDPNYDEFNRSSSRVFTALDIVNQNPIPVEMYVWDESNNSDYCVVNLNLVESGVGNNGDVTLKLSHENTNPGETVCVSLTSENFNDVTSFQGSVSYDQDILRYKEARNFLLPGMTPAGSTAHSVEERVSFVWFDQTGVTPANVAAGEVLFDLCFDVIGIDGDRSVVGFDNTPTAVEVASLTEVYSTNLLDGSVTVGQDPGCINDITPPVAICLANLVAQTLNGEMTLYARDLDAGSYDNCTANLAFTFTNVSPANDPSYNSSSRTSSKVYTLADTDVNGLVPVTLYIWDDNNNSNACWTTLKLEPGQNCDITEDDIIWPTAVVDVLDVTIADQSLASSTLSPDNLMANYGFALTDVYPTYLQGDCSNMLEAYDDLVLPLGNPGDGLYKIVRTWTVLDWLTANVYEGSQVISTRKAEDYICDTLPRSADFGDCESGHTDTDDVEWPNDITIDDHRISPDELVSVSGIAAEDARPTFYNEPEKYEASYVDFVNSLTQDFLEIGRLWTATRADLGGATWTYEQVITVDLADFGNLVTISTMDRRPVPDVTVDGVETTDETGTAFTDQDLDPFKDDVATNGINIKDVVMMRSHLLGIELLDEKQLIAADINEDARFSNQDISDIKKVILRLDENLSTDWVFEEDYTGVEVEPKANYIAIKPGDLDDTAELGMPGDVDPTERIIIENKIINAGQSYSIPLYFGRDIFSFGAELHLQYDSDALTIKGVSATDAFGDISWSLKDDNKITILNYNSNAEAEDIKTDTPILTLEVESKENGILEGLLAISEEANSWILDDELNLLLIDGIYEGNIVLGAEDVSALGFSLYPNPADAVINVNSLDHNNWTIDIYDLAGRQVFSASNNPSLDVRFLEVGMYVYKIKVEDQIQTGKFLIKR